MEREKEEKTGEINLLDIKIFRETYEKALQQGIQQGLKEGLKEAIELVLLTKFGKKAKGVIRKVKQIDELEKLKELKKQVLKAKNIKDFEKS